MPANRFNGFSNYGVGIGLRMPHYEHIFAEKPVVGWFEIISENYMVDGGRALQTLDQILERYRVVQHGVSMYFVGTAIESRAPQAPKDAHTANEDPLALRPPLLGKRGWALHARSPADALHLRGSKDDGGADTRVQDFLEIPIAVENVSSYAEFHQSEMTEWEFLNEVVEAADCGILLDVNNIYVSSQNHGFNPLEYVNSIPAERVAQIHVAGHSKFEKYILDTHDHPVLDRFGICMRVRSSELGLRRLCSNGTTTFPPSTRCTPRR